MTESLTLGDALPLEIERVRVVLGHYKDIGPAGMFGAAFIQQDIKEAETAIANGDVVAMIRAFKKLQEIEG